MMVPSKIDDRYEVKEVLGRGGMGVVYKAYDSQRRGYVALKTMKDAADPAALKLFAQEWRTLANISHPNIVDIFNSGEFEEDGLRKPYFVMPLLPGKTLDSLIKDASHRLTAERAVDILVQTCRGLQSAHDQGLIHRDLKPSNLFVMNDDAVKIIDFGMVHLADVRNSATSLKGTLQYMAPEQLDMKELTAATDIFSLGVVAYEALTGRKPFDRGNESATAQAIRSEFPPPASDLNPAVSKVLGQVVAKAMAKGPWNRFGSAREFGDYLQKALKREEIELFDPARIQPRVERVRRALGEGDLEYANEIMNDLQSEGRVDSEIARLQEEVRQATHSKLVRQLLDGARLRLQEAEFPLAWQKVQEALQKDPENTEAQALQAEIESGRSDQQSEKWRRLVQQHLHNNAFTQARQAIEEIRKIGRDDVDVAELIAGADRRENEYLRACEDKERQFQSAMDAYSNGEISTALSKLQKILEPGSRSSAVVVSARDEIYRGTYNRIRTEWEAVQHAIAEVEKVIATGHLGRAAEMVKAQSEQYPNDYGLQALKLNIEDQIRQEKSAYIAETGRRVESEPDLDRAVKFLDEALERYPNEPHLEELAVSLRKRRDLVESIATKAHQYEELNQVGEALGQWKTLRSIYHQYPGLELEIQRVQLRLEQQKREEAKLSWVDQIDRLLQSHDYDRAHAVAQEALVEFPGDQELLSLNQVSLGGQERSHGALLLMELAQKLSEERRFKEAIELLRRATDLDPTNAAIRNELANALSAKAKLLLAHDWRAAEPLIEDALRIAPANALAKSLRPSVVLAKKMEFVEKCVSQARELQAGGNINAALATVQEGLASYPNDNRLVQLQNALRSANTEEGVSRRGVDREDRRQLSRQVEGARDETSLTNLFERSAVWPDPYPHEAAFSSVVSDIEERTKIFPVNAGSDISPVSDIAREAPRRPHSEAVAGIVTRWSGLGSELAARLNRQISSLRDQGTSVWPGVNWRPTVGWVRVRGDGRSWTQQAGLALVLLIAVANVSSGRKSGLSVAPATPLGISTAFEVIPGGAEIMVDGHPIQGLTASLMQGPHQVVATKTGYKAASQQFRVDTQQGPVQLKLVPEPHVIRISSDLPTAKVLLDDLEIGSLQGGNFSYDVNTAGLHTLRLVANKDDIFSLKLQLDDGAPARLVEPPATRSVPVVVVSMLGSHALVHSSGKETRVKVTGGDLQNLPPAGRDLGSVAANSEITFEDGKKALTLPVEMSNAPVLSIRAGSANKGTLAIEALEGASVYINGVKDRRSVQRGRWIGQLDPGNYTVRVALEGYEGADEQKLAVAGGKSSAIKFTLNRTITVAFLRIEGGTPDADVWLDGNEIGKLDSGGSLAAQSLTPDAEHSIRVQKENYEPFETSRRAPVKDTILISAAEARLKPFGTLAFDVQPPDAVVTVHRTGEAAREVSDKTLHLRAGAYLVSGAAEGYEQFQREEQVSSGQTRTVRIAMVRKIQPAVQANRVGIKDLFDHTTNWTEQGDFWIHDGTTWLKEIHFTHVLDVLKPKKGVLKQGKVNWRIFLNREDYIECQLDDKAFYRRARVGGKFGPQTRKPHDTGEGNFVRMEITVAPDHVTHRIGQMTDSVPCNVAGPTGFDGRFGLRLVK